MTYSTNKLMYLSYLILISLLFFGSYAKAEETSEVTYPQIEKEATKLINEMYRGSVDPNARTATVNELMILMAEFGFMPHFLTLNNCNGKRAIDSDACSWDESTDGFSDQMGRILREYHAYLKSQQVVASNSELAQWKKDTYGNKSDDTIYEELVGLLASVKYGLQPNSDGKTFDGTLLLTYNALKEKSNAIPKTTIKVKLKSADSKESTFVSVEEEKYGKRWFIKTTAVQSGDNTKYSLEDNACSVKTGDCIDGISDDGLKKIANIEVEVKDKEGFEKELVANSGTLSYEGELGIAWENQTNVYNAMSAKNLTDYTLGDSFLQSAWAADDLSDASSTLGQPEPTEPDHNHNNNGNPINYYSANINPNKTAKALIATGLSTTCPTTGDYVEQDCNQNHPAPSFVRINHDGTTNDGSDFADNPWACVKDNTTGLIWEVKSNDESSKRYKHKTYRWGGVGAWGSNLNDSAYHNDWNDLIDNTNNLCGQTNWRVPTINELHTIVDKSTGANFIIPNNPKPVANIFYADYFPNGDMPTNYIEGTFGSGGWWTVQPMRPITKERAYLVTVNGWDNTDDGINSASSIDKYNLVRLVANVDTTANPNPPNLPGFPNLTYTSRYTTDHNKGTITDNKTNLMWQKCNVGETGNDCTTGSSLYEPWKKALALAKENSHAGHSDWRLPSIEELRTIVAYHQPNPPLVNTSIFPTTIQGSYWSATPFASENNRRVWVMGFKQGHATVNFGNPDLNELPFRLVRNN